MRKKIFGLGLLAAALTLALVLTGCPNGDDGGGTGTGDNGDLRGLAVRDNNVNPPVTITEVVGMDVLGTITFGVIRDPPGAPGAITWEISPEDTAAITLSTRLGATTVVTAMGGTEGVEAVSGKNDDNRVAVRAVSGAIESPCIQIEIEGPPALGSLSVARFGTTLTRMVNSTQELRLVLDPPNAVPGAITWAPLQGANSDVWVVPAADGLSATLHTGGTATAAPAYMIIPIAGASHQG